MLLNGQQVKVGGVVVTWIVTCLVGKKPILWQLYLCSRWRGAQALKPYSWMGAGRSPLLELPKIICTNYICGDFRACGLSNCFGVFPGEQKDHLYGGLCLCAEQHFRVLGHVGVSGLGRRWRRHLGTPEFCWRTSVLIGLDWEEQPAWCEPCDVLFCYWICVLSIDYL